jgi:MFS family permease
MAFLSNRNINYLNIHLGLVNLLDQSYWIFIPIYLYKQGFAVSSILLIYVVMNLTRIPIRFCFLPLMQRFGIKPALMIGAIGYALSFLFLPMVKQFDYWLLAYIVFFACFNGLHWYAFHTFYSLSGESEARGRHVAVGQALTIGLSALAPLVSAFIIAKYGFASYFFLPSLLVLLMLFLLSKCQNVLVDVHPIDIGRKLAFNLGAKVFLLDAASFYPMYFCWMFTMYLYVGEIKTLSGIISFGILMQILWQLILGALIDRGKGTIITNFAGLLRIFRTLGRAFLPLSMPSIICLEALSGAADVHHNASQPIAIYNTGKKTDSSVWYWLFAETAWDIGTVIGAGSVALLLIYGINLRMAMLVALLPLVLLWWLLNYYFRKNS